MGNHFLATLEGLVDDCEVDTSAANMLRTALKGEIERIHPRHLARIGQAMAEILRENAIRECGS